MALHGLPDGSSTQATRAVPFDSERLAELSRWCSFPPAAVYSELRKAHSGRFLQAEAALAITEFLEAVCSRMIAGALRAVQAPEPEGSNSSGAEGEASPGAGGGVAAASGDKLRTRHLQRGLRGDADLLALVADSPALSAVANHFLDRTTAAALSGAALLGFAGLDDGADEGALIRSHDITAVDWTHHGDAAVVDKDFALLLKRQHPVFILAHESAVFLGAFTRVLLSEIARRVGVRLRHARGEGPDVAAEAAPPASVPITLAVVLAAVRAWASPPLAAACVAVIGFAAERYDGAALAAPPRVRVMFDCQRGALTFASRAVVLAGDAPLGDAFDAACEPLRVPRRACVFVYRGMEVADGDSPAVLAMPPAGAHVFVLPVAWLAHRRREEARRGLLTSVKYNDAEVKGFKNTPGRVQAQIHMRSSSRATSPLPAGSASHSPAMLPPAAAAREARDGAVPAASPLELPVICGGGGGGGGGAAPGAAGAEARNRFGFLAAGGAGVGRYARRLLATPLEGSATDVTRLEALPEHPREGVVAVSGLDGEKARRAAARKAAAAEAAALGGGAPAAEQPTVQHPESVEAAPKARRHAPARPQGPPPVAHQRHVPPPPPSPRSASLLALCEASDAKVLAAAAAANTLSHGLRAVSKRVTAVAGGPPLPAAALVSTLQQQLGAVAACATASRAAVDAVLVALAAWDEPSSVDATPVRAPPQRSRAPHAVVVDAVPGTLGGIAPLDYASPSAVALAAMSPPLVPGVSPGGHRRTVTFSASNAAAGADGSKRGDVRRRVAVEADAVTNAEDSVLPPGGVSVLGAVLDCDDDIGGAGELSELPSLSKMRTPKMRQHTGEVMKAAPDTVTSW